LGKKKVDYNIDVAGILTSLMIVSSATLIIPSVLHASDSPSESSKPSDHILTISRIMSIVLLLFYVLYIYFQTWSHAQLFSDCNEEEENTGGGELTILASSIVLVVSTVAVAICSDYLVDSVDGFVETLGVGRAFIGLIIVPIVGNAGEYVSTVKWARDDMMNLAIGVIAGATLQISLFVTPFLVILGWIIDKPMSLQFDTFETVVLTMSVLVVSCLVRNGQSNYFEGVLLLGT
jgi:Ca2+:H+ antiporter